MSGLQHRPDIAAVVLAAGASRRMPGIKQLLPWKNTTLLGAVLTQLKNSEASDVYLVLGAHKKEILKETDTSDITLIHNREWANGMAESISKTIAFFIEKNKNYDGLLVAVCDQPLLTINHYNKLINSCIYNNRIVSSYYENGIGVPTVFGSQYFEELRDLKGDMGARSIIKKHLKHLIPMDAPDGAIDLDTQELYDTFFRSHGNAADEAALRF
jgi:molybdenum cofactor cytidylyltransferase